MIDHHNNGKGIQDSRASSPKQRAWLAALLLQRRGRLLGQFIAYYRRIGQRLRALPRALRRPLRRQLASKVGLTLAGTVLLLALSHSPARADPIMVVDGEVEVDDNDRCSLIEAIINANDGAPTHEDCDPGDLGSTPFVIQLPMNGNFLLTERYAAYYYDYAGLPAITGEIIIEGNGSTIARADNAEQFRLISTGEDSYLHLQDVIITGGEAQYYGGGIMNAGVMIIEGSTISNNDVLDGYGGGIVNFGTSLTIHNSVISENTTSNPNNYEFRGTGGGLHNSFGYDVTISNSVFRDNEAVYGGAVYNLFGSLTFIESIFSGNKASDDGGAVVQWGGDLNLTRSLVYNNEAEDQGGGVHIGQGNSVIANTTISGNTATFGGGVSNAAETTTIINSTITGNTATYGGGFAHPVGSARTYISRTLLSGNNAPYGSEIYNKNLPYPSFIFADDYNVFGHGGYGGVYQYQAFLYFGPGATDFNATRDEYDIPLSEILDTTLAGNDGLQAGLPNSPVTIRSHALAENSPAIDYIPNGQCDEPPIDGVDQRGKPREVDGNNDPTEIECDVGAFERQPEDTAQPGTLFVSAETTGQTSDGVSFGPEDILHYDGENWSLFFDGSAAGLLNGHDVNAIHINGEDDFYLSFFQNKVSTPGVGNVLGHDILHYDGNSFSFVFDGSDVGLTAVEEKIDALHVLANPPSGCNAYFLLSFFGTGRVPGVPFQGEDVLGFCATNTGTGTSGTWEMVLDGSSVGMPKNSTFSLSADEDASVLYFTTKSVFNVPPAVGGHSMIYQYDTSSGAFSGPLFDAPFAGLAEKINALHVAGEIP